MESPLPCTGTSLTCMGVLWQLVLISELWTATGLHYFDDEETFKDFC